MTKNDALLPVFDRLKELPAKYAPPLTVMKDEPADMALSSTRITRQSPSARARSRSSTAFTSPG